MKPAFENTEEEYQAEKKALAVKKQHYAKKITVSSVLHVSHFGSSVGLAKQRITIKHKGKLKASLPYTQCERILIAAKGVSISSNVIAFCARHEIPVDFIDNRSLPYASLYTHNSAYTQTTMLQLKLIGTQQQLTIAREFVRAKVKNQLNYLKYLDKYHNRLDVFIGKMEKRSAKIKKGIENVNILMGFEGEAATIYWGALSNVLEGKVEFKGRVTKDAKDVVNAALNYGYAILYGKVQFYLVRAGLNLSISFLHAMEKNRPSLVFDMIEEFRTFVVDRTVVSLFNQKEPVKLDKEGLLDRQSRELIAKNVVERLGSYTKHKKESKKVDTIIKEQAYLLARTVNKGEKYKSFIGKY